MVWASNFNVKVIYTKKIIGIYIVDWLTSSPHLDTSKINDGQF